MKIALGCDHGGYAMKEDIKKQLEGLGHEVKDCGTYSTSNKIGRAVQQECRDRSRMPSSA